MTPGELDRLAVVQAEIRHLFDEAGRRVQAWDLTDDDLNAASGRHPATGGPS